MTENSSSKIFKTPNSVNTPSKPRMKNAQPNSNAESELDSKYLKIFEKFHIYPATQLTPKMTLAF